MEQFYDEMKKKKRRDTAVDAAKQAAMSAAGWGGIYGALNSVIHGNRSLPGIALRGLTAAASAAPFAAGSTLLGSKLLGAPDDDESSAYTLRSALGGGLGGALLGGGAGYLLGRGGLGALSKIPGLVKAAEWAKREKALPLDNLFVDYVKKQAANPSPQAASKLGLLLGGIGGIGGAVSGISEGGGIDAMRNVNRELGEDDDVRRSLSSSAYRRHI